MIKKAFSVFIILALLVAGAVLIGGCTQPTNQNIKVIMPFVASSEWLPVYTAINQGYYADEGLNVSVEYTSEGGFGSVKQVAAGNAQFGYSGGDSVILARSQGIPVVSVYQIDHNNVFGILTKKSANITKPADMIGKSIAISAPGGAVDYSIKAILKNSGVDYNTVTFVPVGSAVLSMLLSDKTNAMPDHIMFEELMTLQGVPYNAMTAKDYGANFVTMTLITSDNTAKNNPDLVKKFVRATDKGLKYAVANPEKSVDDYISKFNPEAKES
jgi:ABC-type nitrate/sulfonate/bicarbonate transport system substrate-binding protein